MNDETRELLSAYIDGALTEPERTALEARLAASAELRGALEDLRAVSRSIKDLPREPLPAGFMARLQARKARGDAPGRSWTFLPPAARPVVAALSCGVVALMIWDKVAVPPEPVPIHPIDAVKVVKEENAPVSQLNFSADRLKAASDAKSLDLAGPASEPALRGDESPLVADKGAAPAVAKKFGSLNFVRGGGGSAGRASGSPIASDSAAPASAEPQLTDRTRLQMTEEERSARNEELIGGLEKQKSSMGMRVLPKGEDGVDATAPGVLGFREPPSAPMVRAPVPSLLKMAKPQGGAAAAAAPAAAPSSALGRPAAEAGLVFADARSLASSWVLLGMPGEPPSVDFAANRLVLIKPSAAKIVSVTTGPTSIAVVYRSLSPDEPSDPAADRVAPLPLEPKTVLIYDATPR
jgi:hypothetical protein